MPYTISTAPDRIKNLPQHAKEIWIAAFNSAFTQYKDEGKANATAWAAVKNVYEQDKNGNWILKKKMTEMLVLPVKFSEELDEDENVSEIKIVPVGVWNHPQYGKIKITEKDISTFVENFEKGIRNDIPITEGHSIAGETKPAVGWFKKLINKGRDGLWAVVEWTEKGKELLKQKAYKYFSPEFYTNYEDPETREIRKDVLVGGALVNTPYFKGLPAIVLSELSINNMELENLVKKEISELTDDEIQFIKENEGELTPEEKEKFASILEEEVINENEETEKVEEVKVEDKQEEVKEEIKEEVKEEKVEGQEKNVMIDRRTLKILEEKAEKGVMAMQELRKQKIEGIVDKMVFSEHNSRGAFFPKSKNKIASFLLGLSEEQVKTFQEIVEELPKSRIFEEIGSDSGLPFSNEQALDNLVKIKMSEARLDYKTALEQVIAENPQLFEE